MKIQQPVVASQGHRGRDIILKYFHFVGPDKYLPDKKGKRIDPVTSNLFFRNDVDFQGRGSKG